MLLNKVFIFVSSELLSKLFEDVKHGVVTEGIIARTCLFVESKSMLTVVGPAVFSMTSHGERNLKYQLSWCMMMPVIGYPNNGISTQEAGTLVPI